MCVQISHYLYQHQPFYHWANGRLPLYRPDLVRETSVAVWCSNKGMSEAELLQLLKVLIEYELMILIVKCLHVFMKRGR